MNRRFRSRTTLGTGSSFIHTGDLYDMPSVKATHEAPGLSGKYRYYSTASVVRLLEEKGWFPVLFQEMNVRNADRSGFQKHMIRFRRVNVDMQNINVGDRHLEMILTNAHDGTSAFDFMAGIFEKVCSNGLIVSKGTFAEIKIRHVGYTQEAVLEAANRVLADSAKILSVVDAMSKVSVDLEDRLNFGRAAILIKFNTDSEADDEDGSMLKVDDRRFDIDRLVMSYRINQPTTNLWNLFNVVQEKLINGARFERDKGNFLKAVRGITSINEKIRINRELFALAENYENALKDKRGPQE